MLRIALASIHLLGLAMAVGAIYSRARAFNGLRASTDALRRGFVADNWWGASFGVLLVTGLWRAFAGLEKSPVYYWRNHVFYAKMGLLLLVLLLEIWPMVTLIRWRSAQRRQALPAAAVLETSGKRIARISDVQTLLLVGIVVAAVMMARGYGFR
jgi:putative membrane protein